MLLTAGPTHEAIDPVRFIGNHSSGRMGYALADAFAEAGAQVVLVTGPSVLSPPAAAETINVTTAKEMFEACKAHIGDADIAVFAAAVADFTPEKQSGKKIKRSGDEMVLRLRPTVDIAETLGRSKKKEQLFVGFALETEKGLEHATGKLKKKNLDLVVLNSLADKGAGFGTETNKVTMIDRSGGIDTFDLKSKDLVARDILMKILKLMGNA